jgi:Flp pilus assembly protein CpaB
LPGGRALAGGFLVAAAAVGLFASYLQATTRPAAPFVVARRAVAVGQPLGPADLATAGLDLPASVAAHAYRTPAAVVGRVALAPLTAGELVEDGGLGRGDGGLGGRQVAVPVDPAQVDGLQPGDWVDVLVTQGDGTDSRTDVVARAARLLGVSRLRSSVGGSSSPVARLNVPDLDTVKAIVQAAHDGALTLVPAPAPGNS